MLGSRVVVLALVSLAACGDPNEPATGSDCQSPVDPLPGPVVDLSELADPDTPIDMEFGACTVIQNGSAGTVGQLSLDLDCDSAIVRLQLGAPTIASTSDEVGLEVRRDDQGLNLRITDGLGLVLAIVEGRVEPASEHPLSWQLETACSQASGEVAADLVVRTSDLDEARVEVGEPETLMVESRTYRLSALAASIEHETSAATGTLTLLRIP